MLIDGTENNCTLQKIIKRQPCPMDFAAHSFEKEQCPQLILGTVSNLMALNGVK